MTFHRRPFLQSIAAGSGTLFWSRPLLAAKHIDPFSFAIVTDTHLGRQESNTPKRNWLKAIDEINENTCEFVLHLGDVVDQGRPEQYPIYNESRRLLRKPIFEIPGNHDPSELFSKHVRTPIDTSFEQNGVRFVLFNNSHTDSHLGFITLKQIEWFRKQCEDARDGNLPIVVCCHVPIHKNTNPDRGWYVKPEDGQSNFYEVVDQHADRILAFFHGHFHNGIRGWRDRSQIVEVLCPSVCYNQDRRLDEAIKSGKTTGFFVEELRPGYVEATLGNERLTLQYKPLGENIHGEYTAEWM